MSTDYLRNLAGSKDNDHIVQSRPGQKQEQVDFRYNVATDSYSITFPDESSGQLQLTYLNGSVGSVATWTGSRVSGPSGDLGVVLEMPVPLPPRYRFTYSHFGKWSKTIPNADGSAVQTWGLFVYGQETPTSAVPRSGSATYSGDVWATSPVDPWEVNGTVKLAFDFGTGSLAGKLHPVITSNGWYPDVDYDYGQFDFAQAVHAIGSPRYSGSFSRDGTVVPNSWFEGSLTGPAAQEAIGRFVLPFTRNGNDAALSGVWLAKHD